MRGLISVIETESVIKDIDINIALLRILLRILRHKIDAKLFESKSKMTNLCGEMIVSEFGEYKYIHEIGNKPELIVYWVCDSVEMFKKEISLLINSNQLKINEISKIDVIVGDDHDRGAFRFLMKLLFVMKSEKHAKRTSSVDYIL